MSNPLSSFDSVHDWHSNIKKNNVWTQFHCSLNYLNSIARLADDLPLWLRLQHGSDADSPLGIIVRNDNTEHPSSFHSVRTCLI